MEEKGREDALSNRPSELGDRAIEDLRRDQKRLVAFKERAGYLLERASELYRQAQITHRGRITEETEQELEGIGEEADLLYDVREYDRIDSRH